MKSSKLKIKKEILQPNLKVMPKLFLILVLAECCNHINDINPVMKLDTVDVISIYLSSNLSTFIYSSIFGLWYQLVSVVL